MGRIYLYYHFFCNISSVMLIIFYPLLKIVFTIPSSIIFAKTFFRIIRIIGPRNKPIIPIILNPVYIAINAKIGCVPIFLLTSFGSSICLITIVIIYKPISTKANETFPSIQESIAHGIITVPEPKNWQSIYKCNS